MVNRKRSTSLLAGLLALALMLSLVVGFLPTQAGAASSGELKAQLNALKQEKADMEAEIKKLKKQITANTGKIEDMVAQKDLIDQEIFFLYQQIININDQIATYSLLIADKQEELTAAEKTFADKMAENRERIQAMEEQGEISYWSVLFQANSFADLLDRLNMIREIAAADKRRLDELNAAAKVVADAKAALEEEKVALEQTKVTLDETQKALEAKRDEANALLAELVERGMEYEALIEESEATKAQLLKDIADTQDEYEEARYREWLATSVPPTTKPKPPSQTEPTTKPTEAPKPTEETKPTEATEPGETTKPTDPTEPEATTKPTEPEETTKPTEPEETKPAKITWKVPIRYKKFTSAYGYRSDPMSGRRTFHYGVDLAADEGTKIWATRGGKVTKATYDSSCGYHVVIDHGDGFTSIYMHMTHYVVKKGDNVTQGQVIGYCGSTGKSTGPHLHFGITKNGSYVNPANYISI